MTPTAITISIEKQDEESGLLLGSHRSGRRRIRATTVLGTPAKAIEALRELLAGVQRPPEVRIACRKDLP